MMIGTAVPAHSAPATALRLDPTTIRVTSGGTLTLALWVDDVEDLHRVELHLDYDWAGLEVQDADPDRVSVQIEPGPIFHATCALWNEAINGQIHFVAQRDSIDGPFSGSDIAAYITFLVTATEPTTYTVSFDQAATQLLDSEGDPIAVGQFNGAALVLPPPLITLTGWLTRESWGGDDRSVINAVLYPAVAPYAPTSWGRACTDTMGDFTLEIVDNPQPPPASILPSDNPPVSTTCTSRWAFVRLDFTNYLSECYWECADGDARDIGWHDLEGGDVNEDGCINILDIVQIIGDFGETVETPCYIPCTECLPDSPSANIAPSCDINGDCRVNILDLTQAAGNFGLCSNCP
ncbi:MAG: dockerin type I domain-containing protein [Anaerolineae bacterium]